MADQEQNETNAEKAGTVAWPLIDRQSLTIQEDVSESERTSARRSP
jgi:hypothetical protein